MEICKGLELLEGSDDQDRKVARHSQELYPRRPRQNHNGSFQHQLRSQGESANFVIGLQDVWENLARCGYTVDDDF